MHSPVTFILPSSLSSPLFHPLHHPPPTKTSTSYIFKLATIPPLPRYYSSRGSGTGSGLYISRHHDLVVAISMSATSPSPPTSKPTPALHDQLHLSVQDKKARALQSLTPIQRGIIAVAIGKMGTKPLDPELVVQIEEQLIREFDHERDRLLVRSAGVDQDEPIYANQVDRIAAIQRASFLGSLFTKVEILPHEQRLLVLCAQEARKRAIPSRGGRVRQTTISIPHSDDHADDDHATDKHPVRHENSSEISISSDQLLRLCCPDLDPQSHLFRTCYDLLQGHVMDQQQAYQFAKLLLFPKEWNDDISNDEGPASSSNPSGSSNSSIQDQQSYADYKYDTLRGMAAHVMRIRHESQEELSGIQQAAQELCAPRWLRSSSSTDPGHVQINDDQQQQRRPVVHISEQFDGVETSYLFTPLIARAIQIEFGYRCVCAVNRNPGPKLGYNLGDLAAHLHIPVLHSASQARSVASSHLHDADVPEFGWCFDQRATSPILDHWIDIRRTIIKRPFLAMVEKFIFATPHVDLLLTSVFHTAAVPKMIAMAEFARIPATIVVQRGLEGSLGFPLTLRGAGELTLSSYDHTLPDPPHYERTQIKWSATDAGEQVLDARDKVEPTVQQNAKLIRNYIDKGASGDPIFDRRFRVSMEGIRRAIRWHQQRTLKSQS